MAEYPEPIARPSVVDAIVDDALSADPAERDHQLELLRDAFIPWLATIGGDNQYVHQVARWSQIPEAGQPLIDPVNPGQMLTTIAWNSADALPFPLCISSLTSAGLPIAGVSVAHGNVIAADQGTWTTNESLGTVPHAPASPASSVGCNCQTAPGAATGTVGDLDVRARQMADRVRELEAQVNRQAGELTLIKDSRAWRLVGAYRRVRSRLPLAARGRPGR